MKIMLVSLMWVLTTLANPLYSQDSSAVPTFSTLSLSLAIFGSIDIPSETTDAPKRIYKFGEHYALGLGFPISTAMMISASVHSHSFDQLELLDSTGKVYSLKNVYASDDPVSLTILSFTSDLVLRPTGFDRTGPFAIVGFGISRIVEGANIQTDSVRRVIYPENTATALTGKLSVGIEFLVSRYVGLFLEIPYYFGTSISATNPGQSGNSISYANFFMGVNCHFYKKSKQP